MMKLSGQDSGPISPALARTVPLLPSKCIRI